MSQTLAIQALTKLLGRAERALNKDEARAVTLPFTQATFGEYFALPTHAAKQELHASLREAQRAGAIKIDWDLLAGEDGQIKRILLKDLGTLAQHLGIQTHESVLADARSHLAAWNALPRVREILDAWASLRTVRGRAASEVLNLRDALRVLDFCRARAGEDIAVRTASAALFKNSKRLEELEPWLDILTAEDLQGLRRSAEEVFAGLGLVKHPPAVYLSGRAELELADGLRLQGATTPSLWRHCWRVRHDTDLRVEELGRDKAMRYSFGSSSAYSSSL